MRCFIKSLCKYCNDLWIKNIIYLKGKRFKVLQIPLRRNKRRYMQLVCSNLLKNFDGEFWYKTIHFLEPSMRSGGLLWDSKLENCIWRLKLLMVPDVGTPRNYEKSLKVWNVLWLKPARTNACDITYRCFQAVYTSFVQ